MIILENEQLLLRNFESGDLDGLVSIVQRLKSVALFNPLSLRVQEFIDHSFYRKNTTLNKP